MKTFHHQQNKGRNVGLRLALATTSTRTSTSPIIAIATDTRTSRLVLQLQMVHSAQETKSITNQTSRPMLDPMLYRAIQTVFILLYFFNKT